MAMGRSTRVGIASAAVAVVAAVSAVVVSAQADDHGSIAFECDGDLVEGGQITCTITRLDLVTPTTVPVTAPPTTARPTTVPSTTAASTSTTQRPTTTTQRPTTTTQASTTTTTSPPTACWPNATPMGALPSQPPPIFCTPLAEAHPTFVEGSNSWVDDFQHGHSFAALGEGYRVFNSPNGGLNQVAYWRHADHWMVDVNGRDQNGGAPWNNGGTWMRPDRTFRFVNGKLVVEMDVAAGVSQYGGNAWPELIISTGSEPTNPPVDHLYGYGWFDGHDAVGVRLDREYPITAYYPASGPRQYEAPPSMPFGGTVDDSQWTPQARAAWRSCVGTDPDTECRDRFRWELTRTTITLFVNGVKFQGITNLPPLSDAMVNGNVYVYAASWIHRPSADTVRFHWDRFAVNP
jgi:hypothetical protein